MWVLGLHMPLDFKNQSMDSNFLTEAMANLTAHVKAAAGSIAVVMGDFNSIPEGGRDAVVLDGIRGMGDYVVCNNREANPIPTFYASWCDTAPANAVFSGGNIRDLVPRSSD